MSSPLAENLRVLSARDPALAARIAASAPSPLLKIGKARSGAPLPFDESGERPAPLHSTVDPEREGRRLHDELPATGFPVFLGLAGGYQVAPFCSDPAVSAILVLEKDAGAVRSVLDGMDLSGILGDARVRLIVGAGPAEVERAILDWYLPSVMGDLRTVPWRPRTERDPDYFSELAEAVARASESIRADYAAQARFGRRWFANFLLNMPAAEAASLELPRPRAVLVAGAGPSLEAHIPALAGRGKGSFLVAADTALPVLCASGVFPDLALSVDCQQYSYHHFYPACLSPCLKAVPRLLDLVSPPVLSRLPGNRGFFAGGHPLCVYARRRWRAFPALDTSGGNVAYAAVSLAGLLGAADIRLAGVDFSFPGAKPYARGTYLSGIFGAMSNRVLPEESSYCSLMFRGGTVREEVPGGWRRTTPLLLMYRKSMERITGSLGARVSWPDPESHQRHTDRNKAGTARAVAWEYPPPPRTGWREFLAEYCGKLESLAPLPAPAGLTLREMPAEERDVWSTILPLVPYLERTSGNRDRGWLLSASREWMISRIKAALAPG